MALADWRREPGANALRLIDRLFFVSSTQRENQKQVNENAATFMNNPG